MYLKPQDFLVALKLLALGDQHWTYARLSHELGLSTSETHAAVQRGLAAGLLADASLGLAHARPASVTAFAACKPAAGLADAYTVATSVKSTGGLGLADARPASATAFAARKPAAGLAYAYAVLASGKSAEARSNLDSAALVNRRNLAEFAIHGAKYAFAPERLPVGPGVPTSHAAPAFAGVFAAGHEPLVWPDAHGAVRGEGLLPLHPCVPGAALRDALLYELLALFDALRAGRARERGMASSRLQALIDPATPGPGAAAATNDSKSARRG